MRHPKDDPRHEHLYELLSDPATNDRKRAIAEFNVASLELRHALLVPFLPILEPVLEWLNKSGRQSR